MHIVRVPARENKFPDVLLTLDLLLPASNVDIYCRPGRINLAAAGYFPPKFDYEWKSGSFCASRHNLLTHRAQIIGTAMTMCLSRSIIQSTEAIRDWQKTGR